MDRRNALFLGAASVLAGCGGAPMGSFSNAEAEWPPEGDLVQTELSQVHVWQSGQGTPVVMIHGASGNLRDFTWQLGPEIAKKRRAVAMDRPGFGYSHRVGPNGGDPAVQARALMAAARKSGLNDVIVVGHSWGAAVAMSWALQDPTNVKGVVTVSGAVMPWSDKPFLAELLGIDRLLIGAYFNYLQASAASDGIEKFVTRIFRPQTPPDGYAEHVGGPLALRPPSLAANKEDIRTINYALRRQARDYGALQVPVEVISGTDDFIINPSRQPIPFAEVLPKSHLTLLDGVGHMAHHVSPESIMAALDRLDPQTA